MLKAAPALGVAFALALAPVVWELFSRRDHRVPHIAIVKDCSRSDRAGCTSVVAIAQRAFSEAQPRKGSKLLFLGTGDQSTANEPWLIWTAGIPWRDRVGESSGAFLRRRAGFFDALMKQCAAMPVTDVSPVFLATKRGIEYLRDLGCGPESGCYLYVRTDGEENADPLIRRAITATSSEYPLPGPISNYGIRVVVCGLAETAGQIRDTAGKSHQLTRPRDGKRADRLRQVWVHLFTDRQLVSVEPYCGMLPDAAQ